MKELSIKEKAKRYDEALEKSKILYEQGTITESLCYVFPELKESEDENIRKELIKFAKVNIPNEERYIAWLEKQSEQKPADKVEPKFHEGEWVVTDKNNVVQIKAIEDSKYVLENTMRFSVDYVDKCWRKWTIQDAKDGDMLAIDPWSDYPSSFVVIYKKQNEEDFDSYCFVGFDGKFYKGENGHSTEDIHPATKEQRELLFQNMKEAGYEWNPDTKELKKIEQKPADKVEPKFREGDNIQFKGFGHNRYTIKEVCGLSHYINTIGNRMDMAYTDANFEVIKDSDKVEPKLKVDDWVVSPNGVYWHIDAIRNGRYQVSSDSGECAEWPLYTNIYHRFTIQDAKDGDVLFTSSTASHETFIFKNIDEKGNVKCYFAYDSEDGFREGKYHFIGRAANCKPATKEQCDLLFKKMKEVGYVWDAEKKELKNIEESFVKASKFEKEEELELKKFAEEWDESLYRSDAIIAGAQWYKQRMKEILEAEYERGKNDTIAEMKKSAEDSCKNSDDITTEKKYMTEYKKGFECGKQRVLKYPEDFDLCKRTLTAWSDDFEEEMDRYIEENFYGSADNGFFSNRTKRELEVEDVVRIGCHFAAWQKEQSDKELSDKSRQEWSEEDEKMCQETIDWFEKKCFPYALESENPARESIKWLKSLISQNRWKPSEIQIECLSDAVRLYNSGGYPAPILKGLLEQLKKLKG